MSQLADAIAPQVQYPQMQAGQPITMPQPSPVDRWLPLMGAVAGGLSSRESAAGPGIAQALGGFMQGRQMQVQSQQDMVQKAMASQTAQAKWGATQAHWQAQGDAMQAAAQMRAQATVDSAQARAQATIDAARIKAERGGTTTSTSGERRAKEDRALEEKQTELYGKEMLAHYKTAVPTEQRALTPYDAWEASDVGKARGAKLGVKYPHSRGLSAAPAATSAPKSPTIAALTSIPSAPARAHAEQTITSFGQRIGAGEPVTLSEMLATLVPIFGPEQAQDIVGELASKLPQKKGGAGGDWNAGPVATPTPAAPPPQTPIYAVTPPPR